MRWIYILALFPAGILAGLVNSVAGLASLVSYPALLAVGIPPVYANVTNTAALIFSAVGAGTASRHELRGHKRELFKLLPLTVCGGICGGLLLLAAPATSFEHIVPFFILGAAVLILRPQMLHFNAQPTVQSGESRRSFFRKHATKILIFAAIFLVGAYTGYFGAAAGVVMLAMLAATSHLKFAEYNALKNVSLGASNLVATILFAFRAHIYWLAVAPLAAGFFIGGSIGPHIVRRVPAKQLRIIIAIGAIGLAVYLFIQTYWLKN
ncbi:MAG: sulfite exporter TauE/SafE family protein [Ethanoligenens sp.]